MPTFLASGSESTGTEGVAQARLGCWSLSPRLAWLAMSELQMHAMRQGHKKCAHTAVQLFHRLQRRPSVATVELSSARRCPTKAQRVSGNFSAVRIFRITYNMTHAQMRRTVPIIGERKRAHLVVRTADFSIFCIRRSGAAHTVIRGS